MSSVLLCCSLEEMCCSVLPLLVTLSPLLFLLQLPDIIRTQEEPWEDYKYGRNDLDNKSFCTWKCVLFTLQWPGAFCQVSAPSK